MARFPSVSGSIEREAKILSIFKDMRVRRVPEIILHGSCARRAFLVERFIDGKRLKDSNLYETEKLRMKLGWLKEFYLQTSGGEVRPQELIRRIEKVVALASDYVDLGELTAVLEQCQPEENIPSVCRHGDPNEINFLDTGGEVVAVDFDSSGFDEPPADPYMLVPPKAMIRHAKDLDVLSMLDNVSPFFLAMYANAMWLGQQLRIQSELEKNLLLVDRLSEFPFGPLSNIQDLIHSYERTIG